MALKQFLVLGPVPEESELLASFNTFRFQEPAEAREEVFGFCGHENLLDPPQEDNLFYEGNVVVGLRIDTRKVPPNLLKSHVAKRLKALTKEKDLAFVSKEARISLEDEVKKELLPKQSPVSKVVELAWQTKQGILRVTSSSTKVQSLLAGIFMKAYGCELQPLVPLLLAGRVAPALSVEGLMALDPYDLTTEGEGSGPC
jgi:DNA recombination-dependent growth factor C